MHHCCCMWFLLCIFRSLYCTAYKNTWRNKYATACCCNTCTCRFNHLICNEDTLLESSLYLLRGCVWDPANVDARNIWGESAHSLVTRLSRTQYGYVRLHYSYEYQVFSFEPPKLPLIGVISTSYTFLEKSIELSQMRFGNQQQRPV